MTTPFVSSLRSSSSSSSSAPAASTSAGKTAMLSLFSGLDLALDASGAVVSQTAGGNSAARELLASKGAERQAEAAIAAAQALKRQQQTHQQQKQQQQKPVTALTQALGLFDDEMEQRNAFMSRNTQRRKATGAGRQGKGRGAKTTSDGKDGKQMRGGLAAKGRRRRQEKYKHV